MNAPTIPKEVREQFEDYAYRHYEAARMSVALAGRTVKPKIERADYFKKAPDGQSYINTMASALWVGWKLCLDASAPWLERANLWTAWAQAQDRVQATLPADYAVSLHMEKEGFYVGLTGPDGEMVEYDDPDNIEEVGSMVRIVDAALAAAIAHHSMSLN